MAIAFLATRIASLSQEAVVLKIARPSLVMQSPPTAWIAHRKEVEALRRLHERSPAAAAIVGYLDAGSLRVARHGLALDLPWTALKLVDGGPQGTTLTERVERSIEGSGSAFGGERAARAVGQLIDGLSLVHEAGVIHRDIKPENVLCEGSGVDEQLKLADFGVARVDELLATLHQRLLGTPGYAPPELLARSSKSIGPWTDVFGLAAVIYFLFTGEKYFPAKTAREHTPLIVSPQRRSLLEAPRLAADLRAHPELCRAIDAVLSRATSFKPTDRHASARDFGDALLRLLSP